MPATATAIVLILALSIGSALAQSSGTAQNSGNNQNCPPASGSETTGQVAKTGPGGAEKAEQQRVEHSAILPDAAGQEKSAAETVQQDGRAVVASTDCPKPANRVEGK